MNLLACVARFGQRTRSRLAGAGRLREPRGVPARFAADAGATAAVEFGLLAGCAIELMLEVFQVGLYSYSQTALDRATYKAARSIKLGVAAGQNFTSTTFRNSLCSSLPSAMACSNIVSNVNNTTEGVAPNGFYKFVKTDQSGIIQPPMDNAQTAYCPGGPSSFVYAQVYYAMPVFSPIWKVVGSTSWNGSSVHLVASQSVFKNEPYASGNGSGC